MKTPSTKLLETVKAQWVLTKFEEPLNELHKDVQADIRDYWEGNDYLPPINNYELMHIMIVWAAHQNFKVKVELSYGVERGRARLEQYQEFDMYDVFGYKIGRTATSNWYEENSTPEAVTQVCEWILKNKKVQK